MNTGMHVKYASKVILTRELVHFLQAKNWNSVERVLMKPNINGKKYKKISIT